MKEVYCKLKDVCEIKGGYAFKSNDYIPNGILIIRIGDISDNKVNISQNTVCIEESVLSKYEKFIIKNGDILVAVNNNFSNNIQLYKDLLSKANTTVLLIIIRDNELMNLKLKVGRIY